LNFICQENARSLLQSKTFQNSNSILTTSRIGKIVSMEIPSERFNLHSKWKNRNLKFRPSVAAMRIIVSKKQLVKYL
jgi:hypothetical protein